MITSVIELEGTLGRRAASVNGRAEGNQGRAGKIGVRLDQIYREDCRSSASNTVAALHVLASSPNGVMFELKLNRSPLQHELVAEPSEMVDGFLEVPDRPSLGVEVEEAVSRKYAFE